MKNKNIIEKDNDLKHKLSWITKKAHHQKMHKV